MSEIQVTICGETCRLAAGATLAQAIETYSPYGQEAVICRLNGQMVRSIDDTDAYTLGDGDVLDIYPLIIGG
jgi:hypothetical protein